MVLPMRADVDPCKHGKCDSVVVLLWPQFGCKVFLQQGLPDSSRAQAVLDYHFVNLHWDDDYFPFAFVYPLRYIIPEDSLI